MLLLQYLLYMIWRMGSFHLQGIKILTWDSFKLTLQLKCAGDFGYYFDIISQ